MTISLTTFANSIIHFINQNFIPFLDNNNTNINSSIEKWELLTKDVLNKIQNFNNQQDFIEKVQNILKKSKKSSLQKNIDKDKTDSDHQSSLRVTFEQTEKNNKLKNQKLGSPKNQSKINQQTIQFRDRKTSVDEFVARKQKIYASIKKQERSNSFHTGLQSDILNQIPLVLSPNQRSNQKPRTSYTNAKQNQILSFKSISDFHKSRNNIPSTIKQSQTQQMNQPPELKMLSKKSIQEFSAPSVTQNRPNSYSSNYIESIKKINFQSRSPNQKSTSKYLELDSSHQYADNIIVKSQQGQKPANSRYETGTTMSSIKKKISQGGQFLSSPQTNTDSFSKFMNSFKKLCTTFQSNHQKLLRQDFNNKYINC